MSPCSGPCVLKCHCAWAASVSSCPRVPPPMAPCPQAPQPLAPGSVPVSSSVPGGCVPGLMSRCVCPQVPQHMSQAPCPSPPLPAVSLLWLPTSWLLQGWSCGALPAAAPVPQFPRVPSPHGGVLTPAASPPWGHRRIPQAPGGRRCHSRKKGTGSSSILVLVPSRRGHQPRRATRNTSCIARDTARRGPSRGWLGGPRPRWRVSPHPTPHPTTTGPPPEMDSIIMDTKHQEGRKGARGERSGEAEASGWVGAGGGAFAGTAVAPSPLPPPHLLGMAPHPQQGRAQCAAVPFPAGTALLGGPGPGSPTTGVTVPVWRAPGPRPTGVPGVQTCVCIRLCRGRLGSEFWDEDWEWWEEDAEALLALSNCT